MRELGRWFGNIISKRILLGIAAVAFGFVAVRCFSNVAHFLQARRGSSLLLRGFSRLNDSLSLFGSARYGSSLARLHTWVRLYRFARERDWARRFPSHLSPKSGPRWHCGATPTSRNFTGSNLLPMALISRLADRRCPCSACQIRRILIVIDFSILGASVSFRNFHGLGASLAVFVDSCLGPRWL